MNYLQIKETILNLLNEYDIELAYHERIRREIDIDNYINIDNEKASLQLIVSYFMNLLVSVDCKRETKELLRTTMVNLKTVDAFITFFKEVYVKVISRKNLGYYTEADSLFTVKELELLMKLTIEMCGELNVNNRYILSKINGICNGLVIGHTRTTLSVLQQLTVSMCSLFEYRNIEWVSDENEWSNQDKIIGWVKSLRKSIEEWILQNDLPKALQKDESPNNVKKAHIEFMKNSHGEKKPTWDDVAEYHEKESSIFNILSNNKITLDVNKADIKSVTLCNNNVESNDVYVRLSKMNDMLDKVLNK